MLEDVDGVDVVMLIMLLTPHKAAIDPKSFTNDPCHP